MLTKNDMWQLLSRKLKAKNGYSKLYRKSKGRRLVIFDATNVQQNNQLY